MSAREGEKMGKDAQRAVMEEMQVMGKQGRGERERVRESVWGVCKKWKRKKRQRDERQAE